MRPSKQILEDVIAHPERDELRLEYAAACEAKDPGHARYVRHRIANPTWSATPLRPGWDGEQVEARLAHPFRQLCYGVTIRRGFVEEIAIDPYIFIDRGAELLDMAPIQRVVFKPQPLPVGLAKPLGLQWVPSPVREVMACPHLDRLYSIAFEATDYQAWELQREDVESVLESRYLERLVALELPRVSFLSEWPEDVCNDFWERAVARPEFRKLLSVNLPRDPGESLTFAEAFDGNYSYSVTSPTPMTERGRELERQHGYLPPLHSHNRWGQDDAERPHPMELVLAHQRGELPKFPVGAPITDEMYLLPPPKRRITGTLGNDW